MPGKSKIKKRQKPITLFLIAAYILSIPHTEAQGETDGTRSLCQTGNAHKRPVDNNPVRIEQAKSIISQNKKFVSDANLFIAQAEKELNESKKLQGEARQYQKKLNIQAPLLKGKELAAAKKQYKMDLAAFSEHVRKYNLHTLDVRKNLGHCKASLEAYEKMKKDLALHCDQFHMKDVEPPHICLDMDTTVIEAMGAQNKVQQQAMRVARAEADLEKTERQLQKSIAERGVIDASVMKQSELALKEQALANEFGRLKEEHRQLEVERKAIARSAGKVAVPTVKGKVKKK